MYNSVNDENVARKEDIRPNSAPKRAPMPPVPTNSKANILSASAGSNLVGLGGNYPITKPASNIFIDTGSRQYNIELHLIKILIMVQGSYL